MGNSCSLDAHVRNKQGEVVKSQLYTELTSYLPRTVANEYYEVGTNQSFLDIVKDKAEFDENGEITFKSLKKFAKIKINEEQILCKLKERFSIKECTSIEGIQAVTAFNKNNPFNSEYLAILIPTETNSYRVDIVKNTSKNRSKLVNTIKHANKRDRILYRCRELGVDVNFLSENSKDYNR